MNKRMIVVLLFGMVLLAACASTALTPTSTDTGTSANQVTTTGAKLNLNTVSGDELTAGISNFPSRMIREFLDYRPYIRFQQFRREIGKYVGDAQVAEYE